FFLAAGIATSIFPPPAPSQEDQAVAIDSSSWGDTDITSELAKICDGKRACSLYTAAAALRGRSRAKGRGGKITVCYLCCRVKKAASGSDLSQLVIRCP